MPDSIKSSFSQLLVPSVLTSGVLSAHQKNPKHARIPGFFIPGDTGYFAFENRLSLTSIRATFARQPY